MAIEIPSVPASILTEVLDLTALDASIAQAAQSAASAATSETAAAGSAAQAQAAADAALGAAGWDQSVPDEAARQALTGLPDDWRVYQIAPAPGRIWRWTGTAWADTGASPLAGKADQAEVDALDRAMRDIVNFPLTTSNGGYYNQGNGNLVTTGTPFRYTPIFEIPASGTLIASFRTSATAMAGVVYYDATGAFLGREYRGTGAEQTFTDVTLTRPPGAARMALVSLSVPPVLKVSSPDLISQSVQDVAIRDNAARIDDVYTKLSSWGAEDIGLKQGFYIHYSTGNEAASSTFSCGYLDVSDTDQVRVSSTFNGVSATLAVYYNAAGARISNEARGTTEDQIFVDYLLTIPAGTVKIGITGQHTKAPIVVERYGLHAAGGGESESILPDQAIFLTGDSMASPLMQAAIQAETGLNTTRVNRGGYVTDQISSVLGLMPITLTEAATIPASGGVEVKLSVNPLLNGGSAMAGTANLSIDGIAGVLSTTAGSSPVLTFTRSVPGAAKSAVIGAPVVLAPLSGTSALPGTKVNRNRIAIMPADRNNDISTPIARIASRDAVFRIIDYQISQQRRVLFRGRYLGRFYSGSDPVLIAEDEAAFDAHHEYMGIMTTALPGIYIDFHKMMYKTAIHELGLTPTVDDLSDMERGRLPRQVFTDRTHFIPAMQTLDGTVAGKLVRTCGWIDAVLT
ncbi:hypothetical protein [Gemmobacter sp. 24YEA27]|uniref:hypothetical protein n=1 Tax=Gemmobacter sp. 24YEA27 TaxID=3040672 RepID=UPI0024B3875C|nr:hypothetical protein [Gemmobacter sp. 24YEA27]